MLTVQSSSGLFFAVQYDGTNGQAIAEALRATDYASAAGSITFRAFIMRAGGLLTSGHRFTVPLGYWVVWADEGNPYVIAPPLTTEAFQQQYQVAATAAQVAALSATVAALGVQVTTLDATVVTLSNSLTTTNANVAALTTSLATTNTNVTNLTATVSALDTTVHNIDASWIVSGVLPYQRLAGTIAENQTIVLFNRPTLVTPGTALDCWRWLYNGVRTVYGNEYNLLRVRGVPDDQVPARFMSNVARDGLVTAIVQASLSDASSHLFQVLGNGDIQAAGGLSMIASAPVPVTFVATGAGNAATISDGSATGAPYGVTTSLVAADNRVYLDGSMANNGVATINGGTVLFNVTAAHRPAAWVQPTSRTSTLLATRVTVKPNGDVVADQALAVGATLTFGMSYRKS